MLANTLNPLPAEVGILRVTLDFLSASWPYLLVAMLATLIATPIVRRIAIRYNVIDHPDRERKIHEIPIAYMGGVAVCIGVLAAIAVSYLATLTYATDTFAGLKPVFDTVPGLDYFYGSGDLPRLRPVPLAVVIGIIAIAVTGLGDDVWGWDPRFKVAGQLVAAAALAIDMVGVNVATGALIPILGPPNEPLMTLGGVVIPNKELYYWIGTAIIAIFVLGGCNAANLIDGLDGLLSGVVGVVMIGLLAISALLAWEYVNFSQGQMPRGLELTGARFVLGMAVLGAVLGFLPYNFNPAKIFLGDCGSLLLGYLCVVLILMLGNLGYTHLVFAGLIVFGVPILDTALAIMRRKIAGQPMSKADRHHIHHKLLSTLGSVRKAVLALYLLGFAFATIGVVFAGLVMTRVMQARTLYSTVIIMLLVGAGSYAMNRVKVERQAARAATVGRDE